MRSFSGRVLGLIDPTLVVGDLGCGTGQLTEVVAPYVRRVIAVDGSTTCWKPRVQRLSGATNVDLRQGELESLPIESGELDVAMLSLVLHYSPEPARALAEVGRVVRPGGRVLVVDMLPHDREEYQQQMGHVWLGFSEKQIDAPADGRGLRGCSRADAAGRSRCQGAGAVRRNGSKDSNDASSAGGVLRPAVV